MTHWRLRWWFFSNQVIFKLGCELFLDIILLYTLLLLLSSSVVSKSLQPHERQHARPPHPSPSPRACSNSCPLSWWCHPTISSSVALFSCLQSFPASGSFPISQFFPYSCQSIRASASPFALPMNILGWFPLGLTGLIFLPSKGFSRASPARQFESINSLVLSLLYGPTHIHTWRLENHSFDYMDLFWQSDVSTF